MKEAWRGGGHGCRRYALIRFHYAQTFVLLGTVGGTDALLTLSTQEVAVVPGATHGLPIEKPEAVSRLVLDLLWPRPARNRPGSVTETS